MGNIPEILESGPSFSFEFITPKDQQQAEKLECELGKIALCDPSFISVTCRSPNGVGDTTRKVIMKESQRWDFPVMPHLTCVDRTQDQILDLIDTYYDHGVENILALRGDRNGHDSSDFNHAIELVSLVKEHQPEIAVGVAAHPEVHPDSANRRQDRLRLATKLQLADFAITQFFFDADHYRRLVDELDALNCQKPVIPGIMLFTSINGLKRMAELNDTTIPSDLAQKLENTSSPEEVSQVAIDAAAKLIEDLQDAEPPGLHLYTLNKTEPAIELQQLVAN